MSNPVRRPGATVDAIDVFCGYGGSSQGIRKAGADIRAAANHNQLAIDCHAANFPDVDHWRADMVDPDSGDYMDPADLPPARFAWFSPGCTHHSPANAQKLYLHGRQKSLYDEEDDFDHAAYAKSERSRVTMSCVLRYADRNRPEILVIENVVEVTHWGPGRDGSTFRWWKKSLEKLGYEIQCLFLNSQFFPPCPQSRDRIYIVAWRKGNLRPDLDYRPIAYCTSQRCGGRHIAAVQTWKAPTKKWPLPQWGKYRRQYIYCCPDCKNQVEPAAWPAYSAINWSNLGPTLGERAEYGLGPLANATVARIKRALCKFGGGPPIVIPAKSVWGVDKSVTQPFTAQTTQQDKALISAIIKNNGSEDEAKYRALSPLISLGALTAAPTQALATSAIVQQRYNSNAVSPQQQVPTVTTQQSDLALASVVLPTIGNTYEEPGYTRARHISSPLYTQLTVQAYGFASTPSPVKPGHEIPKGSELHKVLSPALFAKFNGGPGDTAWHTTEDPFNTVTSQDTHGLVVLPWIEQFRADPIEVTRQLATVMSHLRHALVSTKELPVDSITEEDLMNVRFRMLEPDPELRRAMAFEDDYILLGSKTQMTSGLGNAVTPPVASWITERCLATLRGLAIAA